MTKQPNILFLLPDQLRHDFLGCYGADFLHTPAIDSLAARGTRWETAISPVPVCVPARASMISGQHAHASGITHNMAWLRPDRRELGIMTWPEHLSRAGYKTAAIGKMHFYPWDLSEGFQTRIIAEDKRHIFIKDDYNDALENEGYHKEHAREHAGYLTNKGASINPLPDHLQVDRWVGDQTANYLRQLSSDQPFALMVGFPGPHCPYDPPAEALASIQADIMPAPIPSTAESRTHHDAFVAAYRRDWADLDYSTLTGEQIRTIRHHYAVSIERIDRDVANILAALAETGRLDNTIIVFASDHGDYVGDFEMVGKAWFHEPSIRVPLIVTDFRKPQGRVETAQASLLDIYPSFLEWAGVDIPANADGATLSQPDPDRVIVGVSNLGMMARTNQWKLVRYGNGTEALFDLENDPHEQVNCIDANSVQRVKLDAAITRQLLEGLASANADREVPAVKALPPHPFYHRQWHRPYPEGL